MKKLTKAILGTVGTVAAVGAAAYGVCTLIDELLLNRKMEPSHDFSAKVTGCDLSHLDDLLQKNLKWLEDYGYEKHYMLSDRGEQLTGYLMKPEKPSDVFVFCAHGYRCNGKQEFCGFAQYYLKKGINVFFPDHLASGESEGSHCTFGYCETTDCLKWLAYLKDTFGSDIRILLHGVSMGAATVMMMSARDELPENVKMIVEDCGFSSAVDEFTEKLTALHMPASLIISGVNFVNKINLGFDFNDISPIESVQKAKVPMLFVHGTGDTFVPSYMSEACYEACSSEHKELLLIDGADHAQAFVDGMEEYSAKLDEWLNKFVFNEKEKVTE